MQNELRQAVRPQLAHRPGLRLGPRRRRTAAAAAARHRRGDPGALHRSLRTHFGPELRRLDRSRMTRRIPPIAKRVEHRREHHGDVFIDPYEWLRDKSDPEVIDYLEAENAYTDKPPPTWRRCGRRSSTRSRPAPRRPICRCRPGAATGGTTAAASRASSTACNAVVRSAIPTTGSPPVLDEHTEIPGEQVLLDENVEAEGHDFFSLGAASVSLDGNILAYLGRRQRRRAIHVAVQGLTHRRAVRRQDRRHRRGRHLGGRQPHRLLRHRRRRMAPRHRVAPPARVRAAGRAGVPRTRRDGSGSPSGAPAATSTSSSRRAARSPRRSATATPPTRGRVHHRLAAPRARRVLGRARRRRRRGPVPHPAQRRRGELHARRGAGRATRPHSAP